MPNKDTFSIKPIGEFVKRYLAVSKISVDPFARNKNWATHTNDLNTTTSAKHHLDAVEFLIYLGSIGTQADLIILDPPYSPRQISECYNGIGRKVTMQDTQTAAFNKRIRDAALPVLTPTGTVLSFGWNSVGMGKKRGFTLKEIMLCCHGGAHNDTICIAEQREI